MAHGTAQAIGRGLAQNKSLVKLHWDTPDGIEFMEEVLFGLFDHINLKSLVLNTILTKTSSHVLRSLLHCNEILERFELLLINSEREFPMMAVLAGLARNTGLKEVLIQSDSSETNTTLAAAWTDMLRTNTSIKILDLSDDEDSNYDYNLSSAVAEGLVNNSTLETVRLPHEHGFNSDDSFNGPVWQEMLKKNRSLKTFPCIIAGISVPCLRVNTSLELVCLSEWRT
jgi:hypothetical protein